MFNNNWQSPKFENATKVHDWRNHVSEEVQAIWCTFTDAQKKALYNQATDLANREEWY